jgi:excisionase family DNA binding protein
MITRRTQDSAATIAVSIERASELTSLGESTIRKAVAAGELRASRVGDRVVIAPSDLREWIGAKPVAPRTSGKFTEAGAV